LIKGERGQPSLSQGHRCRAKRKNHKCTEVYGKQWWAMYGQNEPKNGEGEVQTFALRELKEIGSTGKPPLSKEKFDSGFSSKHQRGKKDAENKSLIWGKKGVGNSKGPRELKQKREEKEWQFGKLTKTKGRHKLRH